jgi:hypothetical protein
MSTHSILLQDEYPPTLPRTPQSSARNTESNHPRDTSESQRPSAIPRRSINDSRALRPTPAPETSLPTSKVPPQRRPRRYSTPYPFEPSLPDDPEDHGSSRTNLHQFPTSNGQAPEAPSLPGPPGSVPPSRIPKPTMRARSSSKSSRAATPAAKVSRRASPADEQWITNNVVPERLDGSLDLSLRRRAGELGNGMSLVRDEQPPFIPTDSQDPEHESLSDVRELSPQFEHWYRGEGRDGGGRNGGRGEILPGSKEMLEIAMGGHPTTEYVRRRSWKIRAALGLDSPDLDAAWDLAASRPGSISHKWTEDYVLDEPPLTDLEADGDTTDVESYQRKSSPLYTTAFAEIDRSPTPPLPDLPPAIASAPASPSTDRRSPTNAIPQPRSTPRPVDRITAPSATPKKTSTTASSSTSTQRTRIRKKSASVATKSRSAYDAGSHSPPLADAIPPWAESEPFPGSGNWDEVILPTVAKKLRLAQAESGSGIAMLGANSKPAISKAESIPPPAPGTFGYDASKIRGPRPANLNDVHLAEFGVVREGDDPANDTSPTPQPTEDPLPIPLSPTPASIPNTGPNVAVVANGEDTRSLRRQRQELKKHKPAIRITSPSLTSEPPSRESKDDEHSGGCCGCIIM